MKALSVIQPYAHLISFPDDHPEMKRVENRTWNANYYGPLAIHASKSRKYVQKHHDAILDEDMAFGAFVAVCDLLYCFRVDVNRPRLTIPHNVLKTHPWLVVHKHVEGPWCWLLGNVKALPKPITWSGQLGLWDVPEDVQKQMREQLVF